MSSQQEGTPIEIDPGLALRFVEQVEAAVDVEFDPDWPLETRVVFSMELLQRKLANGQR